MARPDPEMIARMRARLQRAADRSAAERRMAAYGEFYARQAAAFRAEQAARDAAAQEHEALARERDERSRQHALWLFVVFAIGVVSMAIVLFWRWLF